MVLLSGDDLLTFPMISIGGQGVISVMANALPLTFSEMTRAALVSAWDQAPAFHYQLFPYMKLNFEEGNPAGVKMLMHLKGLCNPDVRLPMVKVTDGLKKKMEAMLQQEFLQA